MIELEKVEINNKAIVRCIRNSLPDVRNVYGIGEKTDTFLVSFGKIDNVPHFILVAKDNQKLSYWNFFDTTFYGYCVINKSIIIVCGEAENYIKKKGRKKITLKLYNIPPIIDGIPPLWLFEIDKKTVKLKERYVSPRKGSYQIKFPW
ncbi:MAG: hypothetical protein IJ159_00770 [Prevotella sp.]|nr:hypothetical protein [Prevotella sp.]